MFAFLVTVFPTFPRATITNPNALRHQIGNQKTSSTEPGSPNAEKHGNIFWLWFYDWENLPELSTTSEKRLKEMETQNLKKSMVCISTFTHFTPEKNYPNYQGKFVAYMGSIPITLEEYKILRFQTLEKPQAQGACNSWHIPSMLHRIAIPTKSARQRVPLIQDIKLILSAVWRDTSGSHD